MDKQKNNITRANSNITSSCLGDYKTGLHAFLTSNTFLNKAGMRFDSK